MKGRFSLLLLLCFSFAAHRISVWAADSCVPYNTPYYEERCGVPGSYVRTFPVPSYFVYSFLFLQKKQKKRERPYSFQMVRTQTISSAPLSWTSTLSSSFKFPSLASLSPFRSTARPTSALAWSRTMVGERISLLFLLSVFALTHINNLFQFQFHSPLESVGLCALTGVKTYKALPEFSLFAYLRNQRINLIFLLFLFIYFPISLFIYLFQNQLHNVETIGWIGTSLQALVRYYFLHFFLQPIDIFYSRGFLTFGELYL